ncbi:unnamed protein product [Rhizophagus irregularis]|uniref:Serine-threonine/tyrosine-protein kinase catalytic domain-containing protein n=1 Tax=Rhizophagus irregularis TaxID=588596 RepID=A0A915Z5Z0_9GLOM|nr:unnamed protein product [Rhizophagus irregularis]
MILIRCKLCHFQLNYGKLLSENKDIDVILKGFLQEVQSYCKIGFSHKITKLYVHLLNKCWDATPSNRPTVDEIIQNLNHFETDDIIFEELRNYNNGVIKQYFELTSKSDHLKTSNSSKLHSINPSNFTGVLYCCISNENEEIGSASTSRNNYQVTNLSSETVIIDDSSECDNCIIKLNLSGNYT